jgi:hypothetical protein
VLLAPLAAEVFRHQRANGVPAQQITAALTLLVHRMLQSPDA